MILLETAAPSYTPAMEPWIAEFTKRSPLFAALHPVACALQGADWPDRAALQALLDHAGAHTARGLPVRLVSPGGDMPYEIRVFERGELECRERSWHDLFNVLSWLAFPRAKAALNARHHAAWSAAPAGGRGPVRDALTLFDESGVVVLSSESGLLRMIREFRWKPLFWERRDAVRARMAFLPFGHALCEKALAPYRGMTGHALLVEVDGVLLKLPAAERLRAVDALLCARLADHDDLASTQALSPLPVLGVPGWCGDNEDPAYYDDTRQFRPGRRAGRRAVEAVQ